MILGQVSMVEPALLRENTDGISGIFGTDRSCQQEEKVLIWKGRDLYVQEETGNAIQILRNA